MNNFPVTSKKHNELDVLNNSFASNSTNDDNNNKDLILNLDRACYNMTL